MANIKIYGTLYNDTNEPIAQTTQVKDPTTGKNVNEMIEAAASATAKPWLNVCLDNTGDQIQNCTGSTGLVGKKFFIRTQEQDNEFPSEGSDSLLTLNDYVGLRLVTGEQTVDTYYLVFSYLYDDSDPQSIEFQPFLFSGKLYRPMLTSSNDGGWHFEFELIETGSTESELTAWQKAYLADLEAKATADKFTASMSLSQSSKALDGQATNVTVYVTPKYDGANVNAEITGSGILAGKTFTKGSDGRYSTQVTIPAPTSVEQSSYSVPFAATVKYTHPTAGQLSKSVSATHTQTVKSYVLTEASATDSAITSNLKQYVSDAALERSSLKGTLEVPVQAGGEFVYFVFPTGDAAFTKFTSSGFDVPTTSVSSNAEMSVGGTSIHYRIIKTTSKPQTSPFIVTIA